MRHLTLKVDVDTLRGTEEGVPTLLKLLREFDAEATFLFSLGKDHTGRAIKRAFRPGFFSKVQRTSVVELYGIRTLLYGTLLPGPDIGARCQDLMRSARDGGHETGIHTWDHVLWQDHVRQRDRNWTRDQMQRAWDRYRSIFNDDPGTHGAAGWQMNPFALEQLDDWGMAYASDGRITSPSLGPYRVRTLGVVRSCVQIPTTLPTMDELVGIDSMDAMGAARALLQRTESTPGDHVFTLHTEVEGGKLRDAFAFALAGWRDQGFRFTSMRTYYQSLDPTRLPIHDFEWGQVPGRSGELMVCSASAV